MNQNDSLTNFSLQKPIDLKQLSKDLWINDGSISDLKMNLVDSSLQFQTTEFLTKLEDSWSYLEKRAQDFSLKKPYYFENINALNWEGVSSNINQDHTVNVSTGIDYKMITAIRSNHKFYDELSEESRPCAFVVVSIVITRDNKLVFGKRKYYGDWPNNTFESSGAFLKEADLDKRSLIVSAQDTIREDFKVSGSIKTVPFMIYHLPRILETILLCTSVISISSNEITSDFYDELVTVDNTLEGLKTLLIIPLEQFHPPSRIVIQKYFENFGQAKRLLETLR